MTPAPRRAALWLTLAAGGVAATVWDLDVYHSGPVWDWALLLWLLALPGAVVLTTVWTVPDRAGVLGAVMGAAFPFVWGVLEMILQTLGVCSFVFDFGFLGGGCVADAHLFGLWASFALFVAIPFSLVGLLAGWLTDQFAFRAPRTGQPGTDMGR